MKPLVIPVLRWSSKMQMIFGYIRDCPGCTSRDLAADLDMSKNAVRWRLVKLFDAGAIVSTDKTSDAHKMWFIAELVKQQPQPREVAVRKPAKVAQQNPWSALGL